MNWQAVTSAAFSHYADVALARAWIAYALRLAQRPTPTNYTQAVTYCRSLWTALSRFYLSCNLPPLADPIYRASMLATYGAQFQQNVTDARDFRSASTRTAPNQDAAVHRVLAANLSRVRAPVRAQAICDVLVRFQLSSPSAQLAEQCTGERNGTGNCYYYGPWSHCAQLGATAQGCEQWDANSYAWFETPGSEYCEITSVLPPLSIAIDQARAIITALQSQPVETTILDACRFVLLVNARTAAALGVGPSRLAEEVGRIRGDAGDAGTAALRTASDRLSLIAAGLSAVPGAQVLGAIFGLVAQIARILPPAEGFATDPFGRATPLLERSTITNAINGVPTYDVPPPPTDAASQDPSTLPTVQTPAFRGAMGRSFTASSALVADVTREIQRPAWGAGHTPDTTDPTRALEDRPQPVTPGPSTTTIAVVAVAITAGALLLRSR